MTKINEKKTLTPNKTTIEPTSVNTEIGLAMIAVAKGYKMVLVIPDTMSNERRLILRALGAELLLTPGSKGMSGAVEKAAEIVKQDPDLYFMPQQFRNRANPEIHRRTTAREIIDAVDSRLDFFVAGVGTGGTITGVGQVLKESIPSVKIVAVEPEESPVISENRAGPHKIQGIGAGFIPDTLDLNVIDMVRTIDYNDAANTARRLAQEEGIFVGISSGAAVHIMERLALEAGPNHRLLTILPDTGERYLSSMRLDES